MLTFASSDRPPEAIVSDVMQSDSSSMTHNQKGSLTFTATDTDKKTKPKTRHPRPTGQYVFGVQLDDSLHDVTSIFNADLSRQDGCGHIVERLTDSGESKFDSNSQLDFKSYA